MRRTLLNTIVISLIAALPLLGGCSQNKSATAFHSNDDLSARNQDATDQAQGITYHYYPSVEVYFAPDRETYFWKASAYWGVGRRLPSTYKLDEAERQILTLDTKRPYRVHHKVLARYPRPDMDQAFASVPTDRD